ncbi:MAG: hypothetical protein EPN91_08915 [Salinibacterium sp.]|nr:MAG: hypothetical protein EPN91_08915 [Salinibacterium sp.]
MTATKTFQTLGQRSKWRVVDIVVASVIGVAMGLVFFGWDQIYLPASAPLTAALPGTQSLLWGVWLIPAVLGGLIIRKPGAAIFVEIVAASVEALTYWGWGIGTIEAGFVQGLAVELVLLAFLYANWRVHVAVLAGAAAGLAMGINDLIISYPGSAPAFAVTYAISAIISGAVIAGLGSWLLARAIARTGVLARFASGRDAVAPV